jgi:hypothetical protein
MNGAANAASVQLTERSKAMRIFDNGNGRGQSKLITWEEW